MRAGFTALIVIGLVCAWGVEAYNGIIVRRETAVNSWAQVESQYQRRLDLIPNLVETVKGAANFERGTLEAVVSARARVGSVTLDSKTVGDPAAFKKFEETQGALGSAISRLLVVAENYPQLTATQAFRDLQVQIEGTENRIAVARKYFNDATLDYNASIKVFPGSLIAKYGGFTERPYFAAMPEAAQAPKVNFSAPPPGKSGPLLGR